MTIDLNDCIDQGVAKHLQLRVRTRDTYMEFDEFLNNAACDGGSQATHCT